MDVSNTYLFYSSSPVSNRIEKVNMSPLPVHSPVQLEPTGLSPKVTLISLWNRNNSEHPCLTKSGRPLATSYLSSCPVNLFEDLTQRVWLALIKVKVQGLQKLFFFFFF